MCLAEITCDISRVQLVFGCQTPATHTEYHK